MRFGYRLRKRYTEISNNLVERTAIIELKQENRAEYLLTTYKDVPWLYERVGAPLAERSNKLAC